VSGQEPIGDLWLVRHTETDWNESRRYQGRADRPLTRRGLDHVAAVAARFRGVPVALVVSSGLARTDALAAAIATQAPGARRACDPRWQEIDHGTWEGLTYGEVLARFGASATARFDDPWRWDGHSGETLCALSRRVDAAWDALCRVHEPGGCVIVSHATPIQLLLCRLLQLPPDRYAEIRIDLGGITHLEIHPSGAIAASINDVPTLQARSQCV
jgi:2,3-bisphosphoglycerate-dependent phosphoglycerate mutase/probable phosphoglycerate mutase